ncbi:MAG: hypothetical protein WC091_21570 [Sulfuricellaceae bacterium]
MDKYDEMIERSEKNSAWLATAARASSAKIDNGCLVMELATGVVISIPWLQVQLGTRTPTLAEIFGGGLDVFFPNLIRCFFYPTCWQQLPT